jgi:hypothetical protein
VKRVAVGIGVALVAAGIAIACDDTASSHAFAGRAYEDSRGCLDPGTEIDVVDGPDPGSACAPKCLVSPADPDGGMLTLYISTMCAPFPLGYDTSGKDPRCSDALAAYAQNVTCLADGGIANELDGSRVDAAPATGCASQTLPLTCLPPPDPDPCPQTRASFSLTGACQSLRVYEETCGAYDALFLFGVGSATVLYFEGATGALVAVAKQDTQTSVVTCTNGPAGFVLPTCPSFGAESCQTDGGADAPVD